MLVNLTIPVFELTVVQWAMALQANQAAQTAEAVQATTQNAMTEWAKAAGEMVPAAARAIQVPSMDPSALIAIAESLQKQSQGIVAAYKEGRDKRAAMETAMMQTAAIIAKTQDDAAKAVAELIISAKTAEGDIVMAPVIELPSVVLDNGREVINKQLELTAA